MTPLRLAYFDTSAIVKLYVAESSSQAVAALLESADQLFCHEIGWVETRAALAAAWRQGRIAADAYPILVSDFRGDWRANYCPVVSDPALLERAGELAEGFALRGYDAMHLASAERIRTSVPSTLLVSFDHHLNRAATLLGFALPDFAPLA